MQPSKVPDFKNKEDIHYGAVYERDKGKCQICGRKVRKRGNSSDRLAGTLDHKIALVNGGEHSYDNIQLACLHCNSKKGARKTWLQQELAMVGA